MPRTADGCGPVAVGRDVVEAIQLSAFDSSFLALDGPVSVGHVLTVTPLDREITLDDVRAQVQSRLHREPMLRRKLFGPILGVGRPWWVDDEDFDLDHHLFTSDLGGEADDKAVAAEMVRINMVKLDRRHPLWEVHLVTGVAGDRSVVATKLHHSAADGVAGLDLLTALYGAPDPSDDEGIPWDPDPAPGGRRLLSGGVAEAASMATAAARLTGRVALASPRLVRRSTELVATNLADQLDRLLNSSSAPGQPARRQDTNWAGQTLPGYPPATPFSGAVTANRSWSFGSVPTIASRSMRRSTGTTINDLFVAMTAGALREWLRARDALPNVPLMALIPMSTRDTPVDRDVNNHITLTLCPVPTHLTTPRERLAAAHRDMLEAKRSPTLPRDLLRDISAVAAPTVATLVTQVAARVHLANRVRLPINLMISNVPSPGQTYRVGEAKVTGIHPFPPLSDGLGLNVTGHGYLGDLGMGISSCAEMIPDVDEIRDLMIAEHDRLCEIRMPQ